MTIKSIDQHRARSPIRVASNPQLPTPNPQTVSRTMSKRAWNPDWGGLNPDWPIPTRLTRVEWKSFPNRGCPAGAGWSNLGWSEAEWSSALAEISYKSISSDDHYLWSVTRVNIVGELHLKARFYHEKINIFKIVYFPNPNAGWGGPALNPGWVNLGPNPNPG